jgi:hypothetical protein
VGPGSSNGGHERLKSLWDRVDDRCDPLNAAQLLETGVSGLVRRFAGLDLILRVLLDYWCQETKF